MPPLSTSKVAYNTTHVSAAAECRYPSLFAVGKLAAAFPFPLSSYFGRFSRLSRVAGPESLEAHE